MKKMMKTFIFTIAMVFVASCGKEQAGSTNMVDDFLPVDEAFKYSAQVIDKSTIKAMWKIADGYHLYKNKLKFSVSPSAYQLVNIDYPKGEMIDDKIFGRQESYSGQLEVVIKLDAKQSSEKLVLESAYQGCADKGLCYPPEKRKTTLDINSI